jgi:hypothetical protein
MQVNFFFFFMEDIVAYTFFYVTIIIIIKFYMSILTLMSPPTPNLKLRTPYTHEEHFTCFHSILLCENNMSFKKEMKNSADVITSF